MTNNSSSWNDCNIEILLLDDDDSDRGDWWWIPWENAEEVWRRSNDCI